MGRSAAVAGAATPPRAARCGPTRSSPGGGACSPGGCPAGLRDLNLYAIRYLTQTRAYTFLVTDRYPDADPFVPPTPREAPAHPVRLHADDNLERSRLTVFFRILLAIPHLIWLE